MGDLKKYRKKRDFNKTKEPSGIKRKASKKLCFVVQHHLARKDHYDLRLEYNGVLKSWAVPKGPSYNIKDKRLAIMVEDHPISYKDFEGTIPKGEYGGGTVMVWDYGYYEIINKSPINFKNKTIKFILHGKRLKGAWSLVPFKDNNYLLIKEKDEYNEYNIIEEFETSIITGKTMEEISNNQDVIAITSPNKVVFKSPKVIKEEIVEYYKTIFNRMYPFLQNRLISTIRCPDGIYKECFFKKHFENSKYLKEKKVGTQRYYYIEDINGLIEEAQMNGIEYHIWGSKVNSINKPDILVFDLDPSKEISLEKLKDGVKDLKDILDKLNLKSFLKTSGGKGYHIFVPLKTNSWKETRSIAKNIATLMEKQWPDKYTSNMRKINRKNKIFIDWVRNTKSSTTIAPYSLRARKGAKVSMPIKWSELKSIKPDEITIKDAIKRLKRIDPWKEFFDSN